MHYFAPLYINDPKCPVQQCIHFGASDKRRHWRVATDFGLPVEPDVYSMNATSFKSPHNRYRGTATQWRLHSPKMEWSLTPSLCTHTLEFAHPSQMQKVLRLNAVKATIHLQAADWLRPIQLHPLMLCRSCDRKQFILDKHIRIPFSKQMCHTGTGPPLHPIKKQTEKTSPQRQHLYQQRNTERVREKERFALRADEHLIQVENAQVLKDQMLWNRKFQGFHRKAKPKATKIYKNHQKSANIWDWFRISHLNHLNHLNHLIHLIYDTFAVVAASNC